MDEFEMRSNQRQPSNNKLKNKSLPCDNRKQSLCKLIEIQTWSVTDVYIQPRDLFQRIVYVVR